MTSSYEANRLKRSRPNIYDVPNVSVLRLSGHCPAGQITHKILGTHDAKICEMPDRTPSDQSRPENGLVQFSYGMYGRHEQGEFNTPPEIRRVQSFDRQWLDKRDYYYLPFKFDGTGYNPVRGFRYPETAQDHYDVPNIRVEHRLLQPYLMQQETRRQYRIANATKDIPYCKATDHHRVYRP